MICLPRYDTQGDVYGQVDGTCMGQVDDRPLLGWVLCLDGYYAWMGTMLGWVYTQVMML